MESLQMLAWLVGLVNAEEKSVIELTESQRATLAIIAGVPFNTQVENGKLVTTTAKCGLVRVWGRWELFYQKEKP